jgi:hypothetical protein
MKHGLYREKAYIAWINKRHRYGVSGRWVDPKKYVADVRKHPGKVPMRLDKSKSISPENCRWVPTHLVRRLSHCIDDEFMVLSGTLSRQRIYQLRMKKQGRCIGCGKKAVEGRVLCAVCREKKKKYEQPSYRRAKQH